MRGLTNAFLAFFLAFALVTPAEAGPLSAPERATLLAGELVRRPLETSRGGRHYVGGISYLLVNAPPAEVQAALSTPDSLYHVLPRTRHVEVLQREKNSALVELVSGNSWVTATFSAQLRWTVAPDRKSATVKFWLEPERRADISDLFGYIRVSRFDKHQTLVTVAAMLDLGGGVLGMLFEDRIQASLLRVPWRVHRYVDRRLRARRAQSGEQRRPEAGQAKRDKPGKKPGEKPGKESSLKPSQEPSLKPS